ncbi:hypothetical protein TPHA_0C01360 [Tetrapisispora phaffii CBS 4417]|uniref:SWIRM domain-containing protein n=1 Tax=Tetrapisispora phaffii (strain ATCC 24235 / CBS 4417 / NBRC 1672 / NRRL Y-8282 / UCD 70-5) TaxID=1071381 RepID=G8BRB6_TETPH|nr:hypothetical protein TPHA_0C01360 [Tetrapisispora phaffii CBS 4417]CCE62292.1 hypothetical protein TPHA_0C01360 [Tetrapisispora phaffii CBS 4417]
MAEQESATTPMSKADSVENMTSINLDTATAVQSQASTEEKKMDYDNEAQKLEDKALVFLIKQSRPVMIPDFAKWFDINKIHEIEKKSLPEFFNETSRFKTEKAYKDTRNFIINTYRLSPFEYLTMTSVRRNIAMDISSIYKIFKFVEKWGLINYRIDPRSKSSIMGPSFTGHFKVLLDTPDGLKPHVPMASEVSKKRTRDDIEYLDSLTNNNLAIRKNIYDELQDFNSFKSADKSSTQIHRTFICHVCSNDSIDVYYHNLRLREANLCVNCYEINHFTDNFNKEDYVKLDINAQPDTNWSDQEVVLLLEGLEMYENDWDKIIKHIANNKTIEQCIEKYISLPIDDKDLKEFVRRMKAKQIAQNEKLDTKKTPLDDEKLRLITKTINSLKLSLEKNIDEKSARDDEKTNELIKESQPVIEELKNTALSKIDTEFKKLYELERKLKMSLDSYTKEHENLTNDRMMLSKQILSINKELSNSNVEKKIILTSSSSNGIQIKLLNKQNEINENKQKLEKLKATEIESISHSDIKKYAVVSL